jgi:hypothetical protein
MTTVATRDWLTLDEAASLCDRRRAVEHIATTVDDLDVATTMAALYTHPSLSPEDLALTFEEYREALHRLAALDCGDIGWQDVIEDLTCADRTQAAREHLDALAEIALHELLHGLGGAA